MDVASEFLLGLQQRFRPIAAASVCIALVILCRLFVITCASLGLTFATLRLNLNGSRLFKTKNPVPWSRRTVSNGSRIHCMKVWNPINNKKFETLSYLPPLTDESIARRLIT